MFSLSVYLVNFLLNILCFSAQLESTKECFRDEITALKADFVPKGHNLSLSPSFPLSLSFMSRLTLPTEKLKEVEAEMERMKSELNQKQEEEVRRSREREKNREREAERRQREGVCM